MIVIETSAIVALVLNEPEAMRILSVLQDPTLKVVSAVSRYEAMVVLKGKKRFDDIPKVVDDVLEMANAQTIPFDQDQATFAFQAYARFGKGSGSKAKLNLADCAAYALAMSRGAPLLFVGNDFSFTDVIVA